jgi:hypothetical protein
MMHWKRQFMIGMMKLEPIVFDVYRERLMEDAFYEDNFIKL